ncbi:MAG: UDP-N-acetyl-D-glucosamine 2-epimerase, UDP-hydrolysing [Lentisphaerae bacterium GWF2_44_16]|nr:MAG: UDP-N-acetyl-D-glucosamine 2-epimerase, UDP-hydrolysing [Lentisphaerae bacterium GWF2_44_16]
MTEKRKICVITGTRAEYGQLSRLMKLISKNRKLELQLLVTGAHLSAKFGMTFREIEKDGFRITRKIDIRAGDDSPLGVSKSMSIAVLEFSKAFEKLRPDIIVLLGDRYEMLSAASAALNSRIPVAHLGGGASTEGAIDEAIRHSISKMSHLHFAGAEKERRRVIQLGESPDRVFNFGEPAVDVIRHTRLLKKKELEKKLGRKLKAKNLLITYHPVTLDTESSCEKQFANLLSALDELEDTLLIFTKPNADAGSGKIMRMLEKYTAANLEKCILFSSMGQQAYLSALSMVDAVVGNSSSGIAEAPTFKTPTVNIGDRQKGRIKAASVIDCLPEKENMLNAIRKVYSPAFRKALLKVKNPYGEGGASEKILKVIKTFPLENIVKKKFYDLP